MYHSIIINYSDCITKCDKINIKIGLTTLLIMYVPLYNYTITIMLNN